MHFAFMTNSINFGQAVRRVAVIGGGAAGTLSAIHLTAARAAGRLEVVLIDREGEFGPGVAYGTEDPLHLLNVPAIRMGGISGDPEHFHRWLRKAGHEAAPEDFVPRHLFGQYLRELLDRTELEGGPLVQLERVRGEAVALTEPPSGGVEIELAGGERIHADQAVLAVGALPAADPVPVADELRAAGAYVPNPWAPGALDAAAGDDSVLVIGTGLTMVDVALSLGAAAGGPTIRALSRNGLVPRRHRPDLTSLGSFPVPEDADRLEPIAMALLEQSGRAAALGGDWRDAIDSMRHDTPRIWRGLRLSEKRRFLAEWQRLWDVHRFRMAPRVADGFEALRANGRLSVEAASILAIEPAGPRVRVTFKPAAGDGVEAVEVDRVINCSGAGANVARSAPPLLASLLAVGAARADELGLGLDVDRAGALIDAAWRPSSRLHLVGCLRKGVEWEAIGITEIRDHAAAIARAALAPRPAAARERRRAAPSPS
ncbi:MAG TPA: FAD/NAD(P)-binding protein [Solirubrobacterales bacterium]|nr:FAD/NAD(P)-binding protein [Solirubrobacterales bacterium]